MFAEVGSIMVIAAISAENFGPRLQLTPGFSILLITALMMRFSKGQRVHLGAVQLEQCMFLFVFFFFSFLLLLLHCIICVVISLLAARKS